VRGKAFALVAALAVALVAFLAAQRGGDEEPRLSGSELSREAGRVCTELASANTRLEPPPRPYDGQATAFFAAATENVQTAGERLDALRAPDERSQERLDDLVDRYRLVDDKLEQAEAAASVEQDGEVLALLTEIDELTKEMAGLEHDLGICPAGTSSRVGIYRAVSRTSGQNPLTETGPLVPGQDN
jgi:hypothetical protein